MCCFYVQRFRSVGDSATPTGRGVAVVVQASAVAHGKNSE